MAKNKLMKKILDFASTVISTIILIALGAGMFTGGISVTGVSWLAWMQPAVKWVGALLIVIGIWNVAMSIWNLFTK